MIVTKFLLLGLHMQGPEATLPSGLGTHRHTPFRAKISLWSGKEVSVIVLIPENSPWTEPELVSLAAFHQKTSSGSVGEERGVGSCHTSTLGGS